MKIYTKVVIDLRSGETLHEESYNHEGSVAECKGGSTTTTSVDYEYNARMAAIAETQQAMADEYFQFWQDEEKDFEKAQIDANKELLPSLTNLQQEQIKVDTKQTTLDTEQIRSERDLLQPRADLERETIDSKRSLIDPSTNLALKDIANQLKLQDPTLALRLEQIASDRELLPEQRAQELAQISADMKRIAPQLGLELEQISSARGLLPEQTALASEKIAGERGVLDSRFALEQGQNQFGLEQIENKKPVASEFYKQALSGVDVEGRVSQAGADATQAMQEGDDAIMRRARRMGINPSSGAGMANLGASSLDRARAVGGARTSARERAGSENFGRLNTAMNKGFGVSG